MPEWANKNIEEHLIEAVDEFEEHQKREKITKRLLTSKIAFANFSFPIQFSISSFPNGICVLHLR